MNTTPERVLDRRMIKKGNAAVVQVRVKWTNLDAELEARPRAQSARPGETNISSKSRPCPLLLSNPRVRRRPFFSFSCHRMVRRRPPPPHSHEANPSPFLLRSLHPGTQPPHREPALQISNTPLSISISISIRRHGRRRWRPRLNQEAWLGQELARRRLRIAPRAPAVSSGPAATGAQFPHRPLLRRIRRVSSSSLLPPSRACLDLSSNLDQLNPRSARQSTPHATRQWRLFLQRRSRPATSARCPGGRAPQP
jgi:hypothetical protein